jgi:hypothetical protein
MKNRKFFLSIWEKIVIPTVSNIDETWKFYSNGPINTVEINKIKICSAVDFYLKIIKEYTDLLCLFPRNDDVNIFNNIVVNICEIDTEKIYAIDSTPPDITKKKKEQREIG